MNEGLISRRYAKALFRFAGDHEVQQLIYRKMKLFQENYAKHPGLQKALQNPMLSAKGKEQLLSTAVGIDPDAPYLKAIRLLIRNHREMYMRSISLMYQKIYREAYGIEKVSVISAVPLSEEIERKIHSTVSLWSDKTLEFVYKVDPSIIGGIKLEIGSRLLDASVSGQLKEIRRSL